MTLFTDLPSGLHRARWLNGVQRGPIVFHKFNVVGHGEVVVPDAALRTPDGSTLHTDCNAQLALNFQETQTRVARAPGIAGKVYRTRRIIVTVVP